MVINMVINVRNILYKRDKHKVTYKINNNGGQLESL